MQNHGEFMNTYPCATDAKWAFDVVCRSPKPLGKILRDGCYLVEHDTYDPESDAVLGCSFAESLVHQLDTNLLTSGILFSPYCTLSHLPGIATAPVLRAISSVGVVSILTSLATSAIFRLRMKLLKDPARQEAFAEEFRHAQSGNWSLKYVTVSSPLALIYGSIMVFLVLLSGWTANPGPMRNGPSSQASQVEIIVFMCAVACGIVNCGLALRTAFMLGRRPLDLF